MGRLLLALVAVSASTLGFAADADNWSRFRGPNGNGASADVAFPATWTADDYAWQVTLPGPGHSTPIAWDDKLFLTTGDPATGDVTLVALAADTGATLWSERFKSNTREMHAANSYASSTCAADAERVYVTWTTGDTLQLAAFKHDGGEVWRRELGPVEYRHGFGVSPIVVGDMVVVANDNAGEGAVTALDARSGEPRWQRPRAGGVESYATPAVWSAEDGSQQIIVNSSAEGMAGLSPTDGEVLWQLPDLFTARCVASPLVAGGLVLGGSGEGGNGKTFAAVRPAAAGEQPTVVYQLKKGIPQCPTPVAEGKLLFILNDRGVASCYDLPTGEVHWTERIGGNYFSSPVIAGGKVYCISATGEVVVLAASENFEVLGRHQLGDASNATPLIHRGKMYVRLATSLACLPSE